MKLGIQIIGTVGRDAELKEVSGGRKVTKYSVATKPSKDKTVWVDVTVWDKAAETDAQYVKKGMLVMAEGVLQFDENGLPRTYQKDGTTKAANFAMTAFKTIYLSKVQPTENVVPSFEETEEIPF